MKASDARSVRSRRALLDAGLEMLLQNPNATLSEVAVHAGVGRATLYRHFDTREALIKALLMECLEVTEAVVNPIFDLELSSRETIERMLRVVVPLADKYHFLLSLWSVASNDKEINDIYNQQLSTLYELFEAAKAEGSIKPHLSSDWLVSVLDSLLYSAWWLIGEKQITEQQAVDQILETLFTGIET